MAKQTNNIDFEEELADMKEVIRELVNSKSLDTVKETAAKLGDHVSSLASIGKNKAAKATEETRDLIQEKPLSAVLISFLVGALISRIMK